LKSIVVGLGVQGLKRKLNSGKDFCMAVDPINKSADVKNIRDIPLSEYEAVLLCVPDDQKIEIIKYCIDHKKHILVEKPLISMNPSIIKKLQQAAIKNKTVLYTAYNHRFEPHFIKMKKLIDSNQLGKIYSCRMFYGNGTAKLVKNSPWRDNNLGVITDLGSHLLDTYDFWFEDKEAKFKVLAANCFENSSPDHAIINSLHNDVFVELEMTLCMWRNHFTCDILAENGSAHIQSLCKWGPSRFVHRKRKLPSGIPKEKENILVKNDPTWKLEYQFFKKIIFNRRRTNLDKDIWISKNFLKFKKELSK